MLYDEKHGLGLMENRMLVSYKKQKQKLKTKNKNKRTNKQTTNKQTNKQTKTNPTCQKPQHIDSKLGFR